MEEIHAFICPVNDRMTKATYTIYPNEAHISVEGTDMNCISNYKTITPTQALKEMSLQL